MYISICGLQNHFYYVILQLCNSHVALFSGAGLSPSDKQLILDMHNAMRQSIALGQVGGQPPAANMMEMVSRKLTGTWVGRNLLVAYGSFNSHYINET